MKIDKDEELIRNAIDSWTKGETSSLPSPESLERASSNISLRAGRTKVVLKKDAEGCLVLDRETLEKMASQVDATIKTEDESKSDYEALWDAVRETYEKKNI